MSLGIRLTRRAKIPFSAKIASTPREHLSFLYPQWILKYSATNGRGLHLASQQPSSEPLTSSSAPVSADDIESLGYHSKNGVQNQSERQVSRINATERPLSHSQKGKVREQKVTQEPDSKVSSLDVVERRAKRIESINKRRQIAQERGRQGRSIVQASRRGENLSYTPNWREILAALENNTPHHGEWLHASIELVVPANSVQRFLSKIDDHLLDIAKRYDCSAALGNWDPRFADRSFFLSGSATAISKTVVDILHSTPDIKVKTAVNRPPQLNAIGAYGSANQGAMVTPSETIQSPGFAIQRVGGRPSIFRKVTSQPKSPPRANVAPQRPEEWTPESFLEYVKTLTSSSTTNHQRRYTPGMGEYRQEVISKTLLDIFTDPQCRSSITRTACHEAMIYFVKSNQIPKARKLFLRMMIWNIPPEVETFNILLRGAAKSEDIHNFLFILNIMLRRGPQPNGETWIAFLRCTPQYEIKTHILSAMKQKGLLSHISTLKAACEHGVVSEIESALDQNMSEKDFLAHMDSRYGPQWLSTYSSNRILYALGSRGLISRCWEFLHIMESRFIVPDHKSIDIILDHCKASRNITGMVEVLKNLPKNLRFIPQESTYDILFKVAWRKKYYNFAKVVWKYACLASATNFSMRQHVFGSLKNIALSQVPNTTSERWDKFSAAVILGFNRSSESHTQPVSLQKPEPGLNTTAHQGKTLSKSSGEWLEYSKAKHNATSTLLAQPPLTSLPSQFPKPIVQAMQMLLNHEYQMSKYLVPAIPLPEMLDLALERDETWMKGPGRPYLKENRHWLVSNAVHIPVIQRKSHPSS